MVSPFSEQVQRRSTNVLNYSLIAILDVYQVSLTTVVAFCEEKTAEEVIRATKSGSLKLFLRLPRFDFIAFQNASDTSISIINGTLIFHPVSHMKRI